MRLALFDLDNTLLAGDSDYEWGQFLVDRGVLVREAYEAQNRAFYEQYKAGTLDIHEFLGFALRPLAEHAPEELDGWRREFMSERIAPMMLPAARALVRRHLNEGDLCAIITSTNSFVTRPIALAFGIEHLIATEPQMRDGRFTGEIVGAPCMREGKITRLEHWLQSRNASLGDFPETWFYSDSINDLPLLERVTHPVAVDPDPRLAEIARQRGWRTLTLR
jgi:HAD superfamily hydrolase (TIGR01490 family)